MLNAIYSIYRCILYALKTQSPVGSAVPDRYGTVRSGTWYLVGVLGVLSTKWAYLTAMTTS